MRILRPGEEIEPFYLGTSAKRLFGCYHPGSGPNRDCNVILCYPMGDEYVRAHPAYRQLALRLSKAGFHVLRFDFYGCGDSSGDCEQGEICQWLSDIATAIDEIRNLSGFVKVCLVGFRLGGTLAMMVGAERGDMSGLVLWDVVVSGKVYLEELTTLHHERFRYLHAKPQHRRTSENPNEILGFPLTPPMRRDLAELNLLEIQKKPAYNILFIESRKAPGDGRLSAHLESMKTHLTYQHLPGPQIWVEEVTTVMMPHQILQSIVSWISEVYP